MNKAVKLVQSDPGKDVNKVHLNDICKNHQGMIPLKISFESHRGTLVLLSPHSCLPSNNCNI